MLNLNTMLIWIVLLNCGVALVQGMRSREFVREWLAVMVLVPAAMGVTYLFAPARAGYLGGALWAVFILIPLLGASRNLRLSMQGRYARCARLAAVLRLFHPSRDWWEMPLVFRAQHCAQQGQYDEAAQLLEGIRNLNTPMGRMAMIYLFRMRSQWPEALAWMREQLGAAVIFSDISLLLFYLRALGETGDLPALLAAFQRGQQEIANGGAGAMQQAALFLFAFGGCRPGVEMVFAGALASASPDMRDFWLATVAMVNGQPAAREQFIRLLDSPDAQVRAAAEYRLAHPLADPADALGAEELAVIARLQQELTLEERYRPQAQQMARAYATYVLLAVNTAVFLVAVLLNARTGGHETFEMTLYHLGAMVSFAYLGEDWWRPLTAMFLHANGLHLVMNMLALLIFGRLVESRLGLARFLGTYFIAGIGSMLIAVAFLPNPHEILIGASGALMGLVGAYGALALAGWLRDRAKIALNQLSMIAIIIALQTIFDHITPQVSGAAHLSGAAIGFGVVMVMSMRGKGR